MWPGRPRARPAPSGRLWGAANNDNNNNDNMITISIISTKIDHKNNNNDMYM